MKGKKCHCFCAGIGLVLATGAPAQCQWSPDSGNSRAMGAKAARPGWERPLANELRSAAGAGPPETGKFKTTRRDGAKTMDNIRQIEKNEIRYNEEARGQEYFGWIPGNIPVLISAPHGAKHYRSRQSYWKEEEAYTASLAIALGRATGAHVIYTRNKTPEDPNNDLESRYKEAVRKAVKDNGIRFLIDLHGARKGRPFKIDVGILSNETEKSSCPTFKGILEKNFAGYQKEIFNQKFTANDRCTLTYFARNDLKIEAMQVEINARLRKAAGRVEDSSEQGDPDFKGEEGEFLDLVARIEGVIAEVNEKISETCPEPGKA